MAGGEIVPISGMETADAGRTGADRSKGGRMFGRLVPASIDNRYGGHGSALVLLALIAFARTMQGMESLVNARETMVRADGIPLDSYGSGAADAAVGLFSLLGMHMLAIPLLSVLVLVRYRAMVPLMFLMLLAIQIGSRIVLWIHPIARAAGPGAHAIGFYVNLAILALTAIGFLLSLAGKRYAPAVS
jgi:hypothetical protein